MVQTWIFAANTYGRVAARLGGSAGRRRRRDGGRFVEGTVASSSSTAGWRPGAIAWSATRTPWSTFIESSACPTIGWP